MEIKARFGPKCKRITEYIPPRVGERESGRVGEREKGIA